MARQTSSPCRGGGDVVEGGLGTSGDGKEVENGFIGALEKAMS